MLVCILALVISLTPSFPRLPVVTPSPDIPFHQSFQCPSSPILHSPRSLLLCTVRPEFSTGPVPPSITHSTSQSLPSHRSYLPLHYCTARPYQFTVTSFTPSLNCLYLPMYRLFHSLHHYSVCPNPSLGCHRSVNVHNVSPYSVPDHHAARPYLSSSTARPYPSS